MTHHSRLYTSTIYFCTNLKRLHLTKKEEASTQNNGLVSNRETAHFHKNHRSVRNPGSQLPTTELSRQKIKGQELAHMTAKGRRRRPKQTNREASPQLYARANTLLPILVYNRNRATLRRAAARAHHIHPRAHVDACPHPAPTFANKPSIPGEIKHLILLWSGVSRVENWKDSSAKLARRSFCPVGDKGTGGERET